MKYFSTFSGIGGFELGIKKAYENLFTQKTEERVGQENEEALRVQASEPDNERDKGLDSRGAGLQQHPNGSAAGQPTCVGYSEIDKYATQIYQKHFPEHKNYGDITKIDADTLPDFDCLVGGFPCQAFSIAGKRKGFDDTRGTLFFDLARILKAKQPRLFVFENVKGLLSHDDGNTFKTIISTLDELGYDLQWQVLNSKNHGVPQNRERVFIIGHLRGTSKPKVFPIKTGYGKDTRNVGEDLSYTLDANYHKGTNTLEKGRRQLIQKPYVQNPKMLNFKKDYENSVAITATSYKEPPVVSGIRRLTPTECERLQGFPDGWTSSVSDTQRYKTLGNAVTVNVIEAIFSRILG